MTVDEDHNVWVVDTARADVQVFDEGGRHIRTFGEPGSGDGQLNRPGPAVVASSGEVFIPDFANRRVAVFSADGAWLRNHGSRRDEGLALGEVNAVAVDAKGRMFVLDDTMRIFVLDPGGAPLFTISNDYPGLGRLEFGSFVLDREGRIYIADIGGGTAGRLIVAQLEPPIWPG